MRRQTILIVCSDHLHAASLRATLGTAHELRVVGDAQEWDKAVELARRHAPTAIVLAADLPGRLLVDLARDLREASAASEILVFAERVTFDGATLWGLLDVGVHGCLAWEAVRPEAAPNCILAVLGGVQVISRVLLEGLGL